MRRTFINELISAASIKDNIFLLVGDLGFSVVEPFAEKYPSRYLNCGVAEQNMTGIAAGLALEGYKVFTYSIGNFNTIRCLEQIRNDICYHNLDVTIVSVGAGFSYGAAGYSHHAVQDIALLGSMPNMSLLLPGDPIETKWCLDYAVQNNNPKYLRLGKTGEKNIHAKDDHYSKIFHFTPNIKSEITIVTTSNMLETSKIILEYFENKDIPISLYSVPVIDNNFNQLAEESFRQYKYIFTIEEHISSLGIGAVIRKSLELAGTKVVSFGIEKNNIKAVGSQNYLRKINQLDPKSIIDSIFSIIK